MKNRILPLIRKGSPASSALTGAGRALPIVMGYIPIGFAFGVLAQKAGISTANTLLLSVMVYAGSAQLIAVGLIAYTFWLGMWAWPFGSGIAPHCVHVPPSFVVFQIVPSFHVPAKTTPDEFTARDRTSEDTPGPLVGIQNAFCDPAF